MNLSKSRYCKGIQCPKMLWMDGNMPEQYDPSVMNDIVLMSGEIVGNTAKGYYGEYAEVPFSEDKSKMIAETKRLMDMNTGIIAEASFYYDGNFCMVDILRLVDGGYEIIEVKSSSNSKGVKQIYFDELAYQLYVLSNCGVPVKSVFIMQINSEYVRKGDLNIKELFILTDCSQKVFDAVGDVERKITEIKIIAAQKDEPESYFGERCNKPYKCGYKEWCYSKLPKNNIFDIGWGMYTKKKETAYKDGVVTFADVLNSTIEVNEQQRLQVKTVVHDLPPSIDKNRVSDFISRITYPLYHLDFETFQQAIPLWDDISPYTHIPFQFSIHLQNEPCGDTTHKEFLAKEGIDPRRELAERICTDIPMNVCIIAYNMFFEKGVIAKLAELYPDLSEHLLNLNDNMIDLALIFKNGAYYCREMRGSYSIKSVLPALFPNDPELNYDNLDIIRDGNDVMTVYPTLHEQTPDYIKEVRKALLDYCKLDTLAMVKILGKLYEVVGDKYNANEDFVND